MEEKTEEPRIVKFIRGWAIVKFSAGFMIMTVGDVNFWTKEGSRTLADYIEHAKEKGYPVFPTEFEAIQYLRQEFGYGEIEPSLPSKTIIPENLLSKLQRAIEAKAGAVERSISKIAWDRAHDKIKVTAGKMNYRTYQVLDCAADLIAQDEVFPLIYGEEVVKRERYFVPIPYSAFRRFIDDKDSLNTEKVAQIFRDVVKITLDGQASIPSAMSEKGWVVTEVVGHFCEMIVASEKSEYAAYRSKRKMRGLGSEKEEPVFVLLFVGPYGLYFVKNAMRLKGIQFLDRRLYRLSPEAQELYQAVRWKTDFICLNVGQLSKMVNWVWPPKNFKNRTYSIRKLLNTLHTEGFITKFGEIGETWKTKAWQFRVFKTGKILTVGKMEK